MDMPFLMDTIPQVKRLADAFRSAQLPVVYVVTARRSDNSDAQVPFWRPGFYGGGNRTFVAEGSWGARIVDDLEPREGEHVVIKKGYGGFSNTPLDTSSAISVSQPASLRASPPAFACQPRSAVGLSTTTAYFGRRCGGRGKPRHARG